MTNNALLTRTQVTESYISVPQNLSWQQFSINLRSEPTIADQVNLTSEGWVKPEYEYIKEGKIILMEGKYYLVSSKEPAEPPFTGGSGILSI